MRAADLKGFQYSREDVDARSLANQYAQILGQVFTHEMKPMEVEILVAEVGITSDGDNLFHILYDGTVMDERKFSVLGGDAEAIALRLRDSFADGLELAQAVRIAAAGARRRRPHATADDLEVAILERTNGRRCFRRADRRRHRRLPDDASTAPPAGPVTDAPPAPDAQPVDSDAPDPS